jgi:hypothetical protein
MKQVKNDFFQMTHLDTNPDELEDRGKNPWKQAHAVSETTSPQNNSRALNGGYPLENRKTDMLGPR